MLAQPQSAFNDVLEDPPVAGPVRVALARMTLSQMFNKMANGEEPQQPLAHGKTLLADAELAADVMKQVGTALAEITGGVYLRGPAKDIERAEAKIKSKSSERAIDLSYNHDFARCCIPLRNNNQIRHAIDIFHSPGTIRLANGLKLHVLDVDNTFIKENPKKPGLRNLDLKIAVPITLKDGTESYHIAELQFRHKGAEKAYTESHAVYVKARKTLELRQDFEENKMDMTGSPDTIRSLVRCWQEYDATYNALMAERHDINRNIAKKLGLDELIGYQPCSSRSAQMLAPAEEKVYQLHH